MALDAVQEVKNIERNIKITNIAEHAAKALLVAGIATIAFSLGIYYTSTVASNWMFGGYFWYVDTGMYANMIAAQAGAATYLSAGIATAVSSASLAFTANMIKRSLEHNLAVRRDVQPVQYE